MTVYILFDQMDNCEAYDYWSFREVIGVYSSLEKAKEAAEKFIPTELANNNDEDDEYNVYEENTMRTPRGIKGDVPVRAVTEQAKYCKMKHDLYIRESKVEE